MVRFGSLARVGTALAASGLVLGLSALPAGSQVVSSSSLAVTGSATCVVTPIGQAWLVAFEATNTSRTIVPGSVPAAVGDIDIVSAEATFAGLGVGSVDFSPNPVPLGQTATYSVPVPIPGFITGTVVVTVQWASADTEDSGTEVVTLVLDDSCWSNETTTTTTEVPTTAVPAVEAVAVTPAFTG